jgi:uncharacterized membrane protein
LWAGTCASFASTRHGCSVVHGGTRCRGCEKRDKITNVGPLPKFLWFMLALFAFVNALEALRYLLPHVPFPVQMENFTHRRIALSLHAMGGAIALLAGPLQFVPRFRESNWNRHRLLGWIYCSAVLLGWCASLWIAPHSQTGWMASAAFLALGAAWIVTTGLAVRFILRGDAIGHRRWMIRSFALTAAAITLRMYLAAIRNFPQANEQSRKVVRNWISRHMADQCAIEQGENVDSLTRKVRFADQD